MNTKTCLFIAIILCLLFFNCACKNRESRKIEFELLERDDYMGVPFYFYALIPSAEKYNDSLIILEEVMKHEAMLEEAINREGQHTFFLYRGHTRVRVPWHPVPVHPHILTVWIHENGEIRVFWGDNSPVIDTLFHPIRRAPRPEEDFLVSNDTLPK